MATNQILRVDSTPIIQDNQTLEFSTHQNLDASESGLVTFYRMDGNGNDVIGSNHLSIHGASLSTDRFGNSNQAYYFDGTDDYLVSTSNLGISGSTPGPWFIGRKQTRQFTGQQMMVTIPTSLIGEILQTLMGSAPMLQTQLIK